jgi:hypothetical protein
MIFIFLTSVYFLTGNTTDFLIVDNFIDLNNLFLICNLPIIFLKDSLNSTKLVANKDCAGKLNPWFITGLTDGDGSFTLLTRKRCA